MNNQSTSFLPVFRNFDVDDDELRIQLSNSYLQIAQSVNARQTGFFLEQEFQNGQQWFLENKPAFRKIIIFGAIAAGGTSTVLHNIQSLTRIVDYWGLATTATPDWRQLPYASVTANANIECRVTPTGVVINNGAASPNITSAIVILNYLKS